MTEHLQSPSDDKEANSKSLSAPRVEALKRVKDPRQLLRRDTNAIVVDFDPHFGAAAPATDKDAPTGFRVFDRIGQQIADDALEQDGAA